MCAIYVYTPACTSNVHFSAVNSAYRCDILDHGRLFNVGRGSVGTLDVGMWEEEVAPYPLPHCFPSWKQKSLETGYFCDVVEGFILLFYDVCKVQYCLCRIWSRSFQF